MDIECHGEYWTAFQQGPLRPVISEGDSRYSAIVGTNRLIGSQGIEVESIFKRVDLYKFAHRRGIAGEALERIKSSIVAQVVANRRHEIAVERACRSIDVPRETSLCYPDHIEVLLRLFNDESLI